MMKSLFSETEHVLLERLPDAVDDAVELDVARPLDHDPVSQ